MIIRFLFYTSQWWIFISAILKGNVESLLISIVGMFIGIVWLFPLFISEDINDKKL